MKVCAIIIIIIKTHDSESRGQEKPATTDELFTGNTAKKLSNALAKPP